MTGTSIAALAAAAIATLAATTGAGAVPPLQAFTNVKIITIGAIGSYSKTAIANGFCKGKGFDMVTQYQYSHYEPPGPPSSGKRPAQVYSLIVCMTNLKPF